MYLVFFFSKVMYDLPVLLILTLLPEPLVPAPPSRTLAKSPDAILRRFSLCRLIFLLLRAPICLPSIWAIDALASQAAQISELQLLSNRHRIQVHCVTKEGKEEKRFSSLLSDVLPLHEPQCKLFLTSDADRYLPKLQIYRNTYYIGIANYIFIQNYASFSS